MINNNKTHDHPAFKRTWWINLYPNGQCTGTLCETRESALNRCTYTEDMPDARQIEVRIEPVEPKQDGYFVEVAENGPWLTKDGVITDKWELRGNWPTREEAELAIQKSLSYREPKQSNL